MCPLCGAYLDPGEKCDCQDERHRRERRVKETAEKFEKIMVIDKDGQMKLSIAV